jgi:hypothetical protein
MESNNKTQAAYNKRKDFEKKNYAQYKELDVKPISIQIILGSIMHRCNIVFGDGNKQSLVIHKIDNNLVLSQPRMWEYSMDKLAVLEYLTNIVFFNDTYTIVECAELYKESKHLKKYKIIGSINSSGSYIYALSTESFQEEDFYDYDIRCKTIVAKVFKFKTRYG